MSHPVPDTTFIQACNRADVVKCAFAWNPAPAFPDDERNLPFVIELLGFRRYQHGLIMGDKCFGRTEKNVRVVPFDRIPVFGVPVAIVDPDAHDLAGKIDGPSVFDFVQGIIGIRAGNGL